MADSSIHGGCLCGAVRFAIDPPFQKMIHCHCSRCRKGSGTGHATNLTADAAQLRWLAGEDAISRYELPSAKAFGKWFCRHCGAPLPRLRRNSTLVVIPAGSLDTPPPLTPTDHIFWASRAPWACGSGGLPTHDEYPASW
ncbi:GFA family protein [Solimonas flava]|uniref:GFA family protein n=1 Tax=Solimonas flava TaxID=415849 RepID=UPI00042068F6|nr:GFA family protein [Solimonas flava]